MSNDRRVKIEGAWYFFTVVTYKRRNFLADDSANPAVKCQDRLADVKFLLSQEKWFGGEDRLIVFVAAFDPAALLPEGYSAEITIEKESPDTTYRYQLTGNNFETHFYLRICQSEADAFDNLFQSGMSQKTPLVYLLKRWKESPYWTTLARFWTSLALLWTTLVTLWTTLGAQKYQETAFKSPKAKK